GSLYLPIWQVQNSLGSVLLFEMGDKFARQKLSGETYYEGSVALCIYDCGWVISEKAKVLADSSYNTEGIESVLTAFYNKSIKSIKNPIKNKVVIKFSGDLLMILTDDDVYYRKDSDFFNLFTPNGVVYFTRESKFGFEEPGK